MQSAAPIFDYGNTLEGRGFYLCPEADCFAAVNRNKKIRTIYFPRRENLEDLKREVLGTILKIIKKDLNLCKRMGYSFHTSNEEKSIHEDEHILLRCDNLPEEKVTMHTAACALPSKISFTRKEDRGSIGKGCKINHSSPFISRLMINLQKYEMLSSKGPAL